MPPATFARLAGKREEGFAFGLVRDAVELQEIVDVAGPDRYAAVFHSTDL